MSKVTYHKVFQTEAQDSIGHYWIEVYKDDELFLHIEYEGYSGYAVADEKYYLQIQYPHTEGYTIKF